MKRAILQESDGGPDCPPPISMSTIPNVNRSIPVRGSCPTVAKSSPKVEAINPFLYFYSYTFVTALFYLLLLSARASRVNIRAEWAQHRWSIVAVAVLNTFTYLLVLVALSMSKASYVGALRQVSLVIGIFLGWWFLNENIPRPKLVSVLLLVAASGLIALAR